MGNYIENSKGTRFTIVKRIDKDYLRVKKSEDGKEYKMKISLYLQGSLPFII